MADTIKSDIQESVAAATLELVSLVIEPHGADLAGLLRRFPELADLLQETTNVVSPESTSILADPASGERPLEETQPYDTDGSSNHSEPTGTLTRGRALDVVRQFEGELKQGRSPRMEDYVRDVPAPQGSLLLASLLAAEVRFRVRNGERPAPEEYHGRFPDRQNLVKTVFAIEVGPERIGPYFVIRLLGEGNFGKVYLCRDEQHDPMVAVKVPRGDRFDGTADLERFLQEARHASQVKHAGIVAVQRVERDPVVGCFLVMEYIEGRSLSELLKAEHLPPSRAAQLLALVADALSYAHEQKLVHRDLKPDNILMDSREQPHIVDFGLALHDFDRWPKKGQVAGTPHYMAPEQVRGESHRLDGRTDIWALGVILYRMLTGHRPFDGRNVAEIFEEIAYREPVPPRQRDRTIPRGLERICLKCLSKLMTDRYATASDLAEDLRFWLRTGEEALERKTAGPLDGTETAQSDRLLSADSLVLAPVRTRPKGLRAFDQDDRDFFLGLLPGPRDRDGLPESLRFWKVRIEPGEYEDPFAVGLLCGPSGSGKTSLVKAGLLCRLSAAQVISVYVEASPGATETRLLTALRRVAGGGADGLSLPETVAAMRRRELLPQGRKILIVLDQFEQWLHADHEASDGGKELTRALRHCDGTNVQCLILVRDDFAMAAARFMRALEIRLIENDNFATVDLFDLVHAQKVLREFGVAYERYREDDRPLFDRFLARAVADLAQEGKIAPVRLALFAQMLKDKPWVPATLRDMRGLEGIGIRFLEESLDGPVANPEHRLNVPAARHVLRALLPHGAADIKGHMRSYHELLEASGYARRPGDFDTLLSILDTELRLITPTDPQGADAGDIDIQPCDHHAGRYYHLTHDYLVPSLREWLTRKERQTIAGRAAIRLADRTAEWTARPSRRYLPTWWEWLVIMLFTRRSRRSPAERRLVRAATGYHATRAALVAAAAVAVCLFTADRLGAVRAKAAVRELENAESRNVPKVIRHLESYRRWADPLLRDAIGEAAAESRLKDRARLALLPVDAAQAGGLVSPMIDGDPDLFLVIRQALCDHGDRGALANKCRELLANEREAPDRRLRAGMALAGVLGEGAASEDAALRGAAGFLASHFVNDLLAHPDRYHDWMLAMEPARTLLIPPLEQLFRATGGSDSVRSLAASILARFAAADLDVLTRLLLDANERQFSVIFQALSDHATLVTPRLTELVKNSATLAATREDKINLARRQANAAIALARLGAADSLWPLLAAREDPGLRSFLIDRIAPLETPTAIVIERLAREQDRSVRAALLLSLGRFTDEQIPESQRSLLVPDLVALFQNDPDPAVHSAAGSLLRTWGHGKQLRLAEQGLASLRPQGGRRWYVCGDGVTMATLPGKDDYRIGSPEGEPGRLNSEVQRTVDVRLFEIATTEVTVSQFRPFLEQNKDVLEHYPAPTSPGTDLPQTHVTWYEAAQYCNWRSQQEGIPEEEWCYEPNAEGWYGPGMKIKAGFLSKRGYRLPLEAEWEYACRAGTTTSRFFGESDELMVRYACCLLNSRERGCRAGSFLPNGFGLFDMQGNVFEWCQENYGHDEDPGARGVETVDNNTKRLVLGGGCYTRPSHLRSAYRNMDPPGLRNDMGGFRLARSRPGSGEY